MSFKFMSMSLLVIGLVAFYNIGQSSSAEPIIDNPPVDTSACYGGEATFHCGSERNNTHSRTWIIDGVVLNDAIAQSRGISTTETNNTMYLTILGWDINKETLITCQMTTTTPGGHDSKSATFTVTDIPPIENLTIGFTNGVMNITWDEPPATPVSYSYSVSINDGVPVPVPSTTLQYSVLGVASCMNYTVSVTVNDIGYTQYQSIPVTRTVQSGYYDELGNFKKESTVDVHFEEPMKCFVTIQFNCSNVKTLLSCNLPIDLIERTTPSKYLNNNITIDQLNTSCEEISLNDTGNYSIGPFTDGSKFNYSLHLERTGRTLLNAEISTYNVQRASITQLFSNETTQMECVFASNSSAKGCSFEFVSEDGITVATVFVRKPAVQQNKEYTAVLFTNIGISDEGYYNVSVYDVDEQGMTVSSSPAYTITNYYHSVIPYSTATTPIIVVSTSSASSYTIARPVVSSSSDMITGVSSTCSGGGCPGVGGKVQIIVLSVIALVISVAIAALSIIGLLYVIYRKNCTQAQSETVELSEVVISSGVETSGVEPTSGVIELSEDEIFEVETSEVELSEIETSVVETPEVELSEVETSGVETSRVELSKVEISGYNQHGINYIEDDGKEADEKYPNENAVGHNGECTESDYSILTGILAKFMAADYGNIFQCVEEADIHSLYVLYSMRVIFVALLVACILATMWFVVTRKDAVNKKKHQSTVSPQINGKPQQVLTGQDLLVDDSDSVSDTVNFSDCDWTDAIGPIDSPPPIPYQKPVSTFTNMATPSSYSDGDEG